MKSLARPPKHASTEDENRQTGRRALVAAKQITPSESKTKPSSKPTKTTSADGTTAAVDDAALLRQSRVPKRLTSLREAAGRGEFGAPHRGEEVEISGTTVRPHEIASRERAKEN